MSELPTVTVTDPTLISQLTIGDMVQVKDASGQLLGVFVPDGLGKLPPGVKSPFSDEEMAARRNLGKPPPGVKSPFTDEEMVELRKQRTGRPLADILRDLEARG